MKMKLVAVVFCATFTLSAATFSPILNVESCTKSKLTVSTYEANDNGVIYIQGQSEDCRQITFSGLAIYDFDFSACGIEWEMLFKIVIQKNSAYQTGADKVIPIFCIADQRDLIVSNSNTADKLDDDNVTMTVKPTAAMNFYKVVSNEEISGREVKLSDILIMTLQLADEYLNDMDIKARYCIASDIVIISDFCSVDTDLFPNFSRFKRGYLMSEFGAFRTTNLESGPVEMNFTCVLQVCMEDCVETNCNGESGWGRKKRSVTSLDELEALEQNEGSRVQSPEYSSHHVTRRQAADDTDIDVGGRVKIVEKYSEIQIVSEGTTCLSTVTLIMTIIVLAAGALIFFGTSVVFYRKLAAAQIAAKVTHKAREIEIRRDSNLASQQQHRVGDFRDPYRDTPAHGHQPHLGRPSQYGKAYERGFINLF